MHISIYCIVLFVCSTQTFNCVLEQYTSIVIFNKSRHLLLLCKKNRIHTKYNTTFTQAQNPQPISSHSNGKKSLEKIKKTV